MLLASILLCTFSAPGQTLAPRGRPQPLLAPAQTAERQHGKLAWLEGSWEDLLAESARSKRIVFLYFWKRL